VIVRNDFCNSTLFTYLGTQNCLQGIGRGNRLSVDTIYEQQLETVQLAEIHQGGFHALAGKLKLTVGLRPKLVKEEPGSGASSQE
jgi:hypothetical protein